MLVGEKQIKQKESESMTEPMQEKLVNILCSLYRLWWKEICSEERKKKR